MGHPRGSGPDLLVSTPAFTARLVVRRIAIGPPDRSPDHPENALADRHESMIDPPIEELLSLTGSKFRLVTVAAQRARQINAYFGHLGEGLGAMVPPQVASLARKPLSIAFEEIDARKIIGVDRVPVDEGADAAAAES